MSAWNDFNDAEQQQSFDLIPKGTVAKVRMTIKPGGYDDPNQGWMGGYATQSFETGSIFLAAEFVVLEGEFAKRKLWSNIGLQSPKGPTWGNMGRTFVRAALNSARNVRPDDNTPQAAAARRIQGFHDLGRTVPGHPHQRRGLAGGNGRQHHPQIAHVDQAMLHVDHDPVEAGMGQ